MTTKKRNASGLERRLLQEDALARICRAGAKGCAVREEDKLQPIFGAPYSCGGRPPIKPHRVTEPPARSADEVRATAESEFREAGLAER